MIAQRDATPTPTPDVATLGCARCGARMRIVSVVREPTSVQRVLEHLGLAASTDREIPTRAWDPVPVDDAAAARAFDGVDAVYADE